MIDLLRNRGIRRNCFWMVCVGLAGALLGTAISPMAALLAAAVALGCMLLSLWYTIQRHREIAALSQTLSRIAGGDYSADLRKYEEGDFSILRDEMYKVARTLAHQAESLQRDKRWLADTLADISHQLKTPLTSMTMMTELLADPALPPARHAEFLGTIQAGTQRIGWLVTALLKLSRLDADAVVFAREPVGIATLVQRCVEPLQILIELKELTLETTLADTTLLGDGDWLAEAVGNLLKNCVEYAPVGGRVCLRCTANPLYTLLEIEDNGPGIDADDLPHIFQRFYRGKNAAPDSVGIGLALTQTILRRQHGTVEACNLPTGGTRYTVKLYEP